MTQDPQAQVGRSASSQNGNHKLSAIVHLMLGSAQSPCPSCVVSILGLPRVERVRMKCFRPGL